MTEKLRVMRVFPDGVRLIQAIVGFADSLWDANFLAMGFDGTGRAWIESPQAPATKTISNPGSRNTVHFVEAVRSVPSISNERP